MSTPFSIKVEHLYADMYDAGEHLETAEIYRQWAVAHYIADEDHLAIGDITNSLWMIIQSVSHFLSGSGSNPLPPYLPTILRLCWEYDVEDMPEYEEFELTVEKICEAWAKDDFKGRALTIGFIDRQRQLLWDEPFFVAWAARPTL